MSPKRIDYAARRLLVADVVLQVVAHEGVAAASYRRVARESGLSVGSLQHQFESADALLDAAFSRIGERRQARVAAELASLGRPPAPREILEASLRTGLPLDEERRIECLAEAAWVVRAGGGEGSDPSQGLPLLLGMFRGLLDAAQARGELAEGIDPELEARVLWALVAVQGSRLVLEGSTPPETTVQVIEYHLDRIFAPPPGDATDTVTPG